MNVDVFDCWEEGEPHHGASRFHKEAGRYLCDACAERLGLPEHPAIAWERQRQASIARCEARNPVVSLSRYRQAKGMTR